MIRKDMACARQHFEAQQLGSVAMFLASLGVDSDVALRGLLLDAKRHGLDLAGAVISVLDRPMRLVRGAIEMQLLNRPEGL
jgi:hypothetical protein